ncbi:MAG: hypothetical protein HDS06_04840 [Bacteroides sp.]|nr:hypothetical protein [Bacteroides sp.]
MRYYETEYPDVTVRVAEFDINRREAHVMLTCPHSREDAGTQLKHLAEATRLLAERLCMKPVFKRYLLSDATNQSHFLPADDECARSVIQQSPLDGSKGALLVIFQENSDFRELGDGFWADGSGRIWSGDNPSVRPAGSKEMTVDYLDRLSRVLTAAGGSLEDHCLRTWLFVRDIDNNYSGVVKGRNEVFDRHGLTADTHFIASTGIAGQSPDPACLVAFNAFADLSLRNEQIKFLYGKTHLNPTYEYGVAFERGVAVDYGDRRHIYISGTASIDNKGEIVAAGDIVAQTNRMLENISVLLKEGDCSWDDVAHMIVYLRDISDYGVVKGIMNDRFSDIPKAIVLAPVCRPGWLIETECIAIKQIEDKEYEPF